MSLLCLKMIFLIEFCKTYEGKNRELTKLSEKELFGLENNVF